MQLRPYQNDVEFKIYDLWRYGAINICLVMPTGAGKTVSLCSILSKHQGASVAVAHRQELVCQIAMALARYGVRHKIIAPISVIRFIISEQIRELGTTYYDPNALCAVAGVDTLLRRAKQLKSWLNQITLWVTDECHHLQRKNKWGKACELMPNARGLGVTATPIRADGGGLSRDTDGIMDALVEGPTMRELINDGYLTDYRVFVPPSDVKYEEVAISKTTGDYNPIQLKKMVRQSHLVGDVIDHYKRIAPEQLGITFATDVETATDISERFNVAGIPSEILNAKTPDAARAEALRRFKNREILQLVNVDLFGEGFDLPQLQTVSMARKTESYALYAQQFGRGLRPIYAEGFNLSTREGRLDAIAASIKPVAIIIDHASNVIRHGLPDKPKIWSLDSRERNPRSKNPDDDIPLRYCIECTQPYERTLKNCPYCGYYPVPASRDTPEHVDGDLFELSPAMLAELRGEIDRIDAPAEVIRDRMQYAGAPDIAWRSAMKKHAVRQEAQGQLRESIAWWAGVQKYRGKSDSESYRLFYHMFGIDVLSAQTLGKPDAIALGEKINNYLLENFTLNWQDAELGD